MVDVRMLQDGAIVYPECKYALGIGCILLCLHPRSEHLAVALGGKCSVMNKYGWCEFDLHEELYGVRKE